MVDRQRTAITPKGRATLESLLDAGETVAERDGSAGLTVAAVTTQAGLAKGTFYVHFADRATYMAALRSRFQQHVEASVVSAVETLTPGTAFLVAVVNGYLDACLAHRAIKAVIIDAREIQDSQDSDQAMTQRFEQLLEPSLTALGLAPTAVHARIVAAIASEAALLVLRDGADPATVRAAIATWIGRALRAP